MNLVRTHRISATIPLVFSGLAFALVIANILAGVPPQADEGTAAHLFQLLMVAQLPFIAWFAATADFSNRWTWRVIAAQLAAIVAALIPVWAAGY